MAVDTDSLATTEQKRGKGRPRIVLKDLPIDPYELTEYLATIHCTQEEIAIALGISLTSFRRKTGLRGEEYDGRTVDVDDGLARAYERGCNNAKITLRRLLNEHARKHYAAAIFVAKNEIGYTDRQAVEHTGDQQSVTVVNQPERPVIKKRDTVPAMQGERPAEQVRERGII